MQTAQDILQAEERAVKLSEEQALEIIGEYLAAFLGLEQDWGIVDSLTRARGKEEALRAYDEALRSIHKVMDRYGGRILSAIARAEVLANILRELDAVTMTEEGRYVKREKFNDLFDKASELIRKLLETRTSETCLRLTERALAKYPRYMPLSR